MGSSGERVGLNPGSVGGMGTTAAAGAVNPGQSGLASDFICLQKALLSHCSERRFDSRVVC